MTGLFWLGVGWLAYVYVGYPLMLMLLGLVCRVRPTVREDELPSVSVLLAARNEERDIGWKLRETLDWDYPPERLEILVASDASSDRTDDVVEEVHDRRVRFLRLEQRAGKNAALNELARRATGELLFFTDANSSIERGALRRIVRHFADPRVGCVTGEMVEVSDSSIGQGADTYWGYESVVKELESRIGSVLVCVGSVFAVRGTLFTPLDPATANDLELPLRIGHAGHWLSYEPTARSIEAAAGSAREEFRRRRRICAQGLLGMWRLRHTLLGLRGWQFLSRKFLRWFVLVPMALILLSTLLLAPASGAFLVLLVPQVAFYGLALAGWIQTRRGRRVGRLLSVAFYVVLVAAAGLAGVVDACRGRRFHVWEVAALSRGRSIGSA
jgi:cellulose synthase/poly-beta-1,6-N-acetylglucosamine synthase-like glycosyltransferase